MWVMIKVQTRLLILMATQVMNIVAAPSFFNSLRVPIFVKPVVALGYDNNMFKFSSHEMEEMIPWDDALGNAETFDSEIVYPQIELLYSPVFSLKHETNFRLTFGRALYSRSKEKSYSSFSLKFEYHLGIYQWLKVGYSLQPDLYLRPYRDGDAISQELTPCGFANETFYLSYSHPLTKRSWIMIKGRRINQYFKPSFTEFDTEIATGYLRFSAKPIKRLRTSVWLERGRGDNSTYDNGLATSGFNRSYRFDRVGIKTAWRFNKPSIKIELSVDSEIRYYVAENSNDPLHSGRSHQDYRYKLLFQKEFIDGLAVVVDVRYRKRITDSEFNWVTELKSFQKTEFWLTFSYDLVWDLFY